MRKIVKDGKNGKQQQAAEKKVLELEKHKHYKNLSQIDLKLYSLHLKLTKNLGQIIWENFENNLLSKLNTKMRNKTLKLKKKLNQLCGNVKRPKPKERTNNTNHNVVNLSKQSFTKMK